MTRTTGALQTTTTDLLTRLHIMARTGTVDEMELKRIGRDADRLLNADAFMGHQILGAWAALQHDGETARNHHRIALDLAQQVPDKRRLALYNLAVSLAFLGEHAEAAGQAYTAAKIENSTDEDLAEAADASIWAGNFGDAAELMQEMGKAHPQAAAVTAVLASVQRGVFSEAGLQGALAVAHELVRKAKTRILNATIHAQEVENDVFIMEIRLRGAHDTAKDIEREHDRRIMEDPDLNGDPGSAFLPIFQGQVSCGS